MKRAFWGLVIPAITLGACSKDVTPPAMSKQEISHKIDSLSKIRILEVNSRAQRELDHRLKIELKIKVDSIMNAKDSIARIEAAKADTIAKADTVTKP